MPRRTSPSPEGRSRGAVSTGHDLAGRPLGDSVRVTDGGLEADLIVNHAIDLPELAVSPLVEDANGAQVLDRSCAGYAAVAVAAGTGLLPETPTWRANPDCGRVHGYDADDLDRVNRRAVDLARRAVTAYGPRRAAEHHAAQVRSFAEAGADPVHAMTMTGPAAGIGVVRAARDARVSVAISFTVETDGLLPDESTLAATPDRVEAEAPADWYGVNCAHPTHVLRALDVGEWQERLRFLRLNASTMSHAELGETEVLDPGDPDLVRSSADTVRERVPPLAVLDGCCGTDSRQVAELW